MPDGNENKEVQDSKSEKQSAEAKDGELREQMLRLAAEFDNYKKRTKNDIDNARSIGRAEMVLQLLPILDEFELALIAAEKSNDKELARGIEMLYSNFMDMLKRQGLNEIKVDGAFDPYKHEILVARESGEKEGTILEVVKKGYMLEKIMLRPASVIVSKKPYAKNEEGKEETK